MVSHIVIKVVIAISVMIKNGTIEIIISATIALTFPIIITFVIDTPITSTLCVGDTFTLTVDVDNKIDIFITVAISTTFDSNENFLYYFHLCYDQH